VYTPLNLNDIRSILVAELTDRGANVNQMDGDRLEQLYAAFLEHPCTFDFTKPPKEETELYAREFLDSSAAQEILNKESVCG
jgi:16S rRNA G527 N7-methylase RsmG